MNGPEPIAFTDMDAWSRLTGRTPAPHEITALILIDEVRLHPGEEKPHAA
jgi:hypothetical protein